MPEVRFVKSARLVGREEASRSAVLVAGTGITEPSTVHAFDSEGAFQSWAAASPAKKPLLELDAHVARARAEQPIDGRVKEVADRAVAGLYELAERCDLQPVDDELLRRATATSAAGEALFPSLMVLFDAYGLAGGWRPVAGTAPVLDWIGFDDRTSSVWLAGAGVLAQHAWFGGQRIYLLGLPFARYEDLRALGFDNRASSAAVL
jgi:hypothetical protein